MLRQEDEELKASLGCIARIIQKRKGSARQMTHWMKAFATMHDGLGSVPRTHIRKFSHNCPLTSASTVVYAHTIGISTVWKNIERKEGGKRK